MNVSVPQTAAAPSAPVWLRLLAAKAELEAS